MMTMATLSNYLRKRSKEICRDNECAKQIRKNGEHRCESYAYINEDYCLLDICSSDYFVGSSAPCAAISLPWTGTQRELEAEIDDQIAENEADND
jgi:hypothetical protein